MTRMPRGANILLRDVPEGIERVMNAFNSGETSRDVLALHPALVGNFALYEHHVRAR